MTSSLVYFDRWPEWYPVLGCHFALSSFRSLGLSDCKVWMVVGTDLPIDAGRRSGPCGSQECRISTFPCGSIESFTVAVRGAGKMHRLLRGLILGFLIGFLGLA